jgi:hypothetical protein
MSKTLPPLRRELDIMPSPVPEQPGLFIRDPFRYTDQMIIVPPALVQGLAMFDGKRTELDLTEFFVRLTNGDLRVADTVRHLIDTLHQGGFLESEEFHEMRDRKHREFAEAEERVPSHAGTGYPDESEALRSMVWNGLVGWLPPPTPVLVYWPVRKGTSCTTLNSASL